MAANLGERTTCTCCGSTLLVCGNCGKASPRGETEAMVKWGARRFCSIACAQAMRQKIRFSDTEPARKPCQHCGKDCVQNTTESPATFERRKYCSRECGYAARRKVSGTRKAEAEQRRALQRETRRQDELKHAKAAQEALEALARRMPVVTPPPPADVWRPAAWRALDEARR